MEYTKNIIARAKWANTQEGDPKIKKQNLKNAQDEIIRMFYEYVGPVASRFKVNGIVYTPQEFRKKYFSELEGKLVGMQRDDNANGVQYVGSQTWGSYALKTKAIESMVTQLIDNGKTVWLAYEHNSAYVDKKTGIMSISAINIPGGAEPLTQTQRQYFSMHEGGHAVHIVGYDRDPVTNKIIKFKIQNSWGTAAGDNGFYHMYSDYFSAFLHGIYFFNDPKLVMPNPTFIKPVQGDLFE